MIAPLPPRWITLVVGQENRMSAPPAFVPAAPAQPEQTIPVWPQPPVPPVIPPPETIPSAGPRPPMIILPPRWEYRHLTQPVSAGRTLEESELNGLGLEGWELVGIVSLPGAVHFYFKREII